MPGVVVGVTRTGSSGPAVRWAAPEAELHGLPLELRHAWDLPVDTSATFPPGDLPDVRCQATSSVAPGRPDHVLAASLPQLLVLGGRTDSAHVSRIVRRCLRDARWPVAVVPAAPRKRVGRVVVAVSGTPTSLAALHWAEREARLRDAELVVTYVWQPTFWHHDGGGRSLRMSSPEWATARLRGWVHQSLGRDDVQLQARWGGPLDVLLEVGAGADLLVLGRSSSVGAVRRLLRGALSHDLTGLAPCPVVVVPAA